MYIYVDRWSHAKSSVVEMISTRVIVPLILILATFDRQGLAQEDAQRDKSIYFMADVVTAY